MEQNVQLNSFEGGMDMDTGISYMQNNTYRYAQNMRIVTQTDGTNGILQNIESLKKYYFLDELQDQIIISAIAAEIPDENNILQNTAILLTKDKNSTHQNNLYLVTNFDSSDLKLKCVVKIEWNFDLNDKVQMIYNYETRKVYKLYINSPNSCLKIINLAEYVDDWGDKEVIKDPAYFDSTPIATLPPLLLNGFANGSLKAGSYQYFYKLYTASGIESQLSSGSEVIYLAKANMKNGKYSGGYESEYQSNQSIQLSLNLDNDRFDYIKIYRVYWKDNINQPTIELFNENRIDRGINNLIIADLSPTVLNTITQEEFNDIAPYVFQSHNMLQYKNRLFFANVESSSWDISEDYDTRAYRANKNGNVLLNNSTGSEVVQTTLTDIVSGQYKIENDFDAINPMNYQDIYPMYESEEEYAYDTNGDYGGEGINISFNIIYTQTYEAPRLASAYPFDKDYARGSMEGYSNFLSNYMPIKAVGDSNKPFLPIELPSEQLISYANPLIASKFASYQRDEIYRFGIVFYNSNNIATPVHWICDIRFPSGDTKGFGAFEMSPDKDVEVLAKPLGLNFTIKNFPEGAVAAEIVRCDRTFADRTVVAQGMLNNTVYWTGIEMLDEFNPDMSNGENDIRSPFFPTIKEYKQVSLNFNEIVQGIDTPVNWKMCQSVKLFVSPETVFNKNNEIINPGQYIYPIYKSYSRVVEDTQSIIATASQVAVRNDVFDQSGAVFNQMGNVFYSKDYNSKYLSVGLDKDTENIVYSGVVKYYINTSASELFSKFTLSTKTEDPENYIIDIQDAKLARTDLPNQNNDGPRAYKENYVDIINTKKYTNNAVAKNIFTIAGINQLIGIDTESMEEVEVNSQKLKLHILYNGYAHQNNVEGIHNDSLSTIICNIKKRGIPYGGNSYMSRSTNGYISCGGYINKDLKQKTIFGGDVFLTNFDYQQASVFTYNDFNQDGEKHHKTLHVYLPVESTINTYFRSDDTFMKTQNGYLQTNPGVINGMAQDFAMYAYNSCYSVSDGGITYTSETTNDNITANEQNRYRIVCTEEKSVGEAIDSWGKSKFANTLDLDSKNGSINKLVEFKSQMFALQENAVNVISVGDRSLISDQNGAALVLGTGGILNRYDTIINNYGVGNDNDPSVIGSSQNIYWYDRNKNVICSYGNNGFNVLSKSKKVQTFLNNIDQNTTPEIKSFFDDVNNELLMKIQNTCLVYNEHSDCFTSFYTHTPDYGLRFYNDFITIKDNAFYHTNIFRNYSEIVPYESKIKFIINNNPNISKVFDTQIIVGNIVDNDNVKPRNIKEIIFNTKTQNSLNITYKDIQCREDNYVFPIPRQDRGDTSTEDESIQTKLNKSFSPRMRGKYLICDYTFDCNDNKSIQIPFIKTTFRQSNL